MYDEPGPGVIDAIRRGQERHAVFVFTSREIEAIVPWLEAHGVDCAADGPPYPRFWNRRDQVLVNNPKLLAVAYIDERAVRFQDWPQTLAEIEAITPSGR